MHSAILGTAGYTLLVSSLVFLFYALRNKVKRFTISSLHTFAISDILSSLITGVLLIFNQYLTISGPIEPENINQTAVEFFGQTKSSTYFVEHLDGFSGDNETSNACHFRDVVAHYAMFIFPFVNAFVSLLSFSARTCIDLDHVVGECKKFGETKEKNDRTNFLRYKSEKLMTGLGLAGQWIVPILLTAVFNFAADENLANLENSRDIGCVYGMNFPFEHCYMAGHSGEKYLNKSAYAGPAFNDYIVTIDSSQLLANDSSEMEEKFSEIVSKIYDIVETAVNHNESEQMKSTSFYESAHLANITRFMDKNEQEIVRNEDNVRNQTGIHDDEIIGMTDSEKTAENETLEHHEEVPHDEILEGVSPSENDSNGRPTASVIDNEQFSAEEELELFESLLTNSSETLDREKIPETDKVHREEISDSSKDDLLYNEMSKLKNVETGVKKHPENIEDDESVIAESSIQSDKEIYADIVKKIQAVTTQLRGRKDIKYLRKQNERGKSEKYSTVNEDLHKMPVCMKNQCFISTSFLKIHLLVLVFLVYFVPIFTSAILQTRAKYACRNIREKLALEEANKKNNIDQEFLDISRSKNVQSVASTSGWFPSEMNFENEYPSTSFEDLVVPEKPERNTDKLEKQEEEEVDRNSSINIVDQCAKDNEKALESMKKDVCGIEKLLELFQTCFLVAVFSWTPIFLELLTKVFLCMSTVEWLFDVSFLGALLFGIARNILNLRMIRVHDIIRNDCVKDNSVFPSS